ncbi:MAG: PD40 domain-containing protein [Burkholderiales bacterium]|nr:PD40 domain-containing protein [Burkholderiales bacterium]
MITLSHRRLPGRPARWFALWLALWLALACAPARAQPATGFYRFPALQGQQLWFTAEGDIWRVGTTGGRAERITTHPGYETHPAVSPDGRWLAFVGAYEGSPDVYLMPTTGGTPRRLSWFGARVQVWGWTPDGEVLATAPAASGAPDLQLYAIAPATGLQRTLPVGQASDGALSADGKTLYFSRGGLRGDNVRAYRGGATARLWQLALGGPAEARPLLSHEAGHKRPMPYLARQGGVAQPRVAFLSDRDGRFNLWSVDAAGGDLRQHTHHRELDIRHASIDDGRVIYALGADLHLVDLATGQDQRLDITLGGDFDHQRTRWLTRAQDFLSHVALSPDGQRVALTVRGRIATVGAAGLRRAEAALPADARCRAGTFGHDGRQVFALCDMAPADEVEVWRLPANGVGSPVRITTGASVLRLQLQPSPDGRWLAHHDKDGRLWLTALTPQGGGKTVQVADASALDNDTPLVWSPDSRALAFTRAQPPSLRSQLVLYRLGEGDGPGRSEVLTSDRYDSGAPAFTPDGKWLYFLSDRHFSASNRHPWGDRDLGPFFERRSRVYALALQPGLRFPFRPRDELSMGTPEATATRQAAPAASATSAAAPAAAKAGPAAGAALPAITFPGLAQRLHEVPLAPGNYLTLRTDGKRLYLLERDSTPEGRRTLRTLAIEDNEPKPEPFMADVRQVEVTPDGKRLLVVKAGPGAAAGDILLLDAGAKAPAELARHTVRWADWPLAVEPRAEWRQMFADAWRMQRDHLYDPGLHGVDWPAVRRRFEPLVDRVTDRAELNELLAQMVSELGLLHSQVGTPDLRAGPEQITLAGLGARLSPVAEGLRIDALYRGDPELPSEAPPLAAPGVQAQAGEIITAVNGRNTRGLPGIAPVLRGLAGRQVLLDLRRPDGSTRQAVVTPVDARREAALRYGDWEAGRAERVQQAGGGRIGYLHLRAMGGDDIATFAREFYAQLDREALVIDVRGNTGGNIDSWIIEKLLRRTWAYWQRRSPVGLPPYGNMQQSFRGHLAVLIDETTYSDGETFAAGVQRLKLGTLVGRPTAGAGVWLSDRNRLLDNGILRAAESGQFTPDGQWLIEGRGVSPDIEVDNPPRASFEGQDAQLDAAVAQLLRRLSEQPLPVPRAPAYPRPYRQP